MNELSNEFVDRIDDLEGHKRIHKLCEELKQTNTLEERLYIRQAISHVIHKTIEEVEAILG